MRRALPTILLALLLAFPSDAIGQGVLSRSPNLSDGWVGESGTLHFNFDHRFRLVSDKVINSPSFLLAGSLPAHLLLGARYASNSRLAEDGPNEWEALVRWSPPVAGRHLDMGATLAYNGGAESLDGELALRLPLRLPDGSPFDSIGLLGTMRGFSEVAGTGSRGWFAGGGLVVHLTDGVSLAGDAGRLSMDGPDVREVWGAALQLRIPTTPHTLSVGATNTNTASLQGASIGERTTWGFEFTIPITLARYFRASGAGEAPSASAPAGDGSVVEVSMNDDLDFVPRTITIRVGESVTWRNVGELAHTVTADPGAPERGGSLASLPAEAESFDSGLVRREASYTHTFTVAGEYRYVCVPHLDGGMVGTIVVEP